LSKQYIPHWAKNYATIVMRVVHWITYFALFKQKFT